jgi:hypothetical protein
MDLNRILSALREERRRVEEAIALLEERTTSREKDLRGRPPNGLVKGRRLVLPEDEEEPEG